MKILEDVFNDRELDIFFKDLEEKKNQQNWGLSTQWDVSLIENSNGIVCTTYTSNEVKDIIINRLGNVLPRCRNIHCLHYFWYPLSQINVHSDSSYVFGATIYLNKVWSTSLGGIFVYEDLNKEMKAFIPRYNSIVMNLNNLNHSVTQISPHALEPRYTIQIFGKN